MKIYADNAATTRVSDTALAAMTPCFQEIYGNPSSLHTPGQRAAEKLAAARAIFARNLHADPRDYDPAAAAGEEILLQGVVDCCFETADGLTVVDFKTDRVFSALEVRQRAEHYRPQLEAYSRALERVLEKKVVRRALYFLAAGETMEI